MTREENILRLVAIEDAASAKRKDNHATKMKELAPTASKLLIEAVYTVGANLGEFASSQNITKGCIASMLLVVCELPP